MESLVDDSIEYESEAITALERFKCNLLYRESGNLEDRLRGMQELVADLSRVYHFMVVPSVVARKIDGSHSGDSNVRMVGFDAKGYPMWKITMRGRLSIITLLHEFAHILLDSSEYEVQRWAVNLFRKVYPRQFAKLCRQDVSDPWNFMYVKR